MNTKGLNFRPVVGFEDNYLVSDNGSVFSLYKWRGVELRKLSYALDRDGYPRCKLTKDGISKRISIHKIVTRAFIGPMPEGSQVRHLDGDKMNNNISNLLYGDAKENAEDRDRHGRTARGIKAGSCKLTFDQVLDIRSSCKNRGDVSKIAKKYGVTASNIYYIINNKSRKIN